MRAKTAPTKRFLSLMHGSSIADWIWIANFERLRSHVYMHSFEGKLVREIAANDHIHWPVVFLLTRYHRKFIVQDGRGPNPADVNKALAQFRNTQSWQWHHRLSGIDKMTALVRSVKCPHCPDAIDPALMSWSASVSGNAIQASKIATRSLCFKIPINLL